MKTVHSNVYPVMEYHNSRFIDSDAELTYFIGRLLEEIDNLSECSHTTIITNKFSDQLVDESLESIMATLTPDTRVTLYTFIIDTQVFGGLLVVRTPDEPNSPITEVSLTLNLNPDDYAPITQDLNALFNRY